MGQRPGAPRCFPRVCRGGYAPGPMHEGELRQLISACDPNRPLSPGDPLYVAFDEGVPVPVLSAALYERFSSRGASDYQDKLLSAMRYQFGGHIEKPAVKGAA